MSQSLNATRTAGLAAMKTFIPAMGKFYTTGRNFDQGPGNHTAVSMLSPYLSRRLLTEQEVVQAAISVHGYESAEKFVQEVIWRGYFKGWLERRPQVWSSYCNGLTTDLQALNLDRRLRKNVTSAMEGQTGLTCFDAWVDELLKTGYLHNHARMWFASSWIFTLKLPWRLGADFFYRHLLDGDAASNTLSWRWVAGLHTRGKPYAATASNIATFTDQRVTPQSTDFARNIEGLENSEPNGLPPVRPLREFNNPQMNQPTALLITDEDCHLEDFDLNSLDIYTIGSLEASHLRSPLHIADSILDFEGAALSDAASRIGVKAIKLKADHPEKLVNWALASGATQIVTPYVTRGPLHDWLEQAKPAFSRAEITFCEWRRDWDSAIWPYTTAGFFKVKKQVRSIIEQIPSI